MMREFDCPSGITVGRGVIEAVLAAFGRYRMHGEKVICRHLGLESIGNDPAGHFSARGFLHALADLQLQFGPAFMTKVGTFIFDTAVFPPGIDSADKALEQLEVAYYMNHVGGRIGGYHWRREEAGRGTMSCDNPYPCAFDLGIMASITRRFAKDVRVTHESDECRHRGGLTCVYRVDWT